MSLADIRKEIPRTFFHIMGGLSIACIAWILDSPGNKLVLGAIFTVAAIGEIARLTIPALNRLTRSLAGPVMRSGEMDAVSGLLPFTGGVLAAFILFSKPVALASLVPLIFGDRAALLVGKGIGRLFDYSPGTLFGAALVGTLAEALPRPFDDNLTIPLAVGLFLTLVS
jgi:dolichol kinase